MAWSSFLLHFTTFLVTYVYAQTISTDTPIAPLQWINISGLLQGSSRPPPLKNAAIGYDETSRTLIIFGGESASGLVQSQTYLLNLDTLTWSIPSPPANLQRTPPARSATVAGGDFAASNRHGFVVIGGKGSDGKGLADVWEYDFINQFWSQVDVSPGGPLPRWGAAGGIDIFTPPGQDPVVPGPNNTFYLAGGYDNSQPNALSDVWRFKIAGTLSSNLPNSSVGSWDHLSIGHLPPRLNLAGAVISNQIIVTGGCNSTASRSVCATQDSYVIDAGRRQEVSPAICPAPRTGPILIPNANKFTSSFSSQAYLLLGTLDETRWNDDNGLDNGEVAVLDINTGSWSRILPAGDPGTSGKPKFPTQRAGSAAFSYPSALVGQSRAASSDTIVFGGQDSAGNLLSEIWLLRSYNGIIRSSNAIWSNFGDGRLQTGVNASGAGVRITFLSKCALAIISNPGGPNSTSSPSPSPTSNPSPTSDPPSIIIPTIHSVNISIAHKILAPVSLVIFQLMFIFFRLSSPLYQVNDPPLASAIYRSTTSVLAFLAYASGIAGLAVSFATISASSSSSSAHRLHLQTGHGVAGLVFFVCLYGILPVLLLVLMHTRHRPVSIANGGSEKSRIASPDTPDVAEKLVPFSGPSKSAPHSTHNATPPSSPRHRTNSWGPSTMIRPSHEGRLSSDSESTGSAGPHRAFEVLNRPSRIRKASGSGLAIPPPDGSSERGPTRSLSLRDIDWLRRRRSLNAVNELDYAITQTRRDQLSSTPATTDGLMPRNHIRSPLEFPSPLAAGLHIVIHGLLIGLCIIVLIALWERASVAAFAVFLVWTIIFYLTIFACAWHLRPGGSILSVICGRLGTQPQVAAPAFTPPTPLPDPSPGPYIHQPPYRAALSPDEVSSSNGGPRSVETADEDDEIDEETRQRMIEEEMGRRDVSIVTVPKRKLWITNPS
ncbi:Dynein regulatory complex subunit 7 [Hypsizygus marmoreus]|uniref:Dynein regulatory complex subunit 7 n=1 Tax=Hypsizygus marmoreus TaxID=39966 RepID=A0A369JV01_HYPMA|nr:Dynein regulatory complex subunit 7 [Hypsizygus marmoreus]